MKLPVVWRLPAGYLTLVARVWDATWFLADDPKLAILVVGLLVTLAFALASEAGRAGIEGS